MTKEPYMPEISNPDIKCTCIGEVLGKYGIIPLAEMIDEIEDLKHDEPSIPYDHVKREHFGQIENAVDFLKANNPIVVSISIQYIDFKPSSK